MNHEERVHFFRNELEKARRDFPKSSTEVKTAANCYQAALSESVSHGSPAIRGSDVGLSDHSKVVLSCDGVNVAALFSTAEQELGMLKSSPARRRWNSVEKLRHRCLRRLADRRSFPLSRQGLRQKIERIRRESSLNAQGPSRESAEHSIRSLLQASTSPLCPLPC